MLKINTTLITLIIYVKILAQSHFSVGLFTIPTYLHHQESVSTVINDNYFNKNQLVLSNGVKLEYAINKSWAISLNPNYFARHFSNSCLDSLLDNNPRPLDISPTTFIISTDNQCEASGKVNYGFIEIPLFLKYTFNNRKRSKERKYISLGTSYIYKVKDKRTFTDNSNPNNVTHYNYGHGIYKKFAPIITGGYEYSLTKHWIAYSEMMFRLEHLKSGISSSLYYIVNNYNIGLVLGIKRQI